MCPGNLERWYSLWPQLVCHGFALGKGLNLHFLLHLPSPRIMFHGGDIDAHDHGQQVVTLKCWIVANKINCWAGHSHLSVSPWQTSLSHPQVLDLAVCCRQQRTTWCAWSFRAWEPLLRCELWRKSLWWKIACARCSSSQAWGKYMPLFQNESQTQSLITGHMFFLPPPNDCCNFISDKNRHPDL